MKVLKRLFVHPWKAYIAPVVVCVLLALLALIFRGFTRRANYYDALTLSGVATVLLGLLRMVWYFGAFDTFGYGFSALFRERDKRYASLYEYSEAKKEKRSKGGWTFMPYIMVGTVVFVVGLLVGIGLHPAQ